VHQSVLRGFLDRLSRADEGLRPGMPWDDGVTITPLPDLAQVHKQPDLIHDAIGKGALIVNRGGGVGVLSRPAAALVTRWYNAPCGWTSRAGMSLPGRRLPVPVRLPR
jgi:acyl-CoA reductase-like NAD-dependent aldehyde dehydrogenase